MATARVALGALLLGAARAANPIVANVGQADPHVHRWAEVDTYYAYATHDYSPQNTGFRMDNWWVWSSADLRNWTLVDILFPNATPAPPADYSNCWATDAAHKRDPATGAWSYYFYMSIGTCQVAVMKSVTTPAGPWINVLGTPLLNSSFGNSLNPQACFRDPAVFEDDDGTYYLISGVFDYYIMRLGDDLVSIAEQPQLVSVIDPTGPYGNKTDDKPFIHKNNGVYYLSWGCFYGTSSSVYGPYTYVGSVISTEAIDPDFRTNSTDGPWYSHEDYMDRHGSFWTNGAGQWFYASNDRSHSTDPNRGVFRDTVIGYVHYYVNASIAPVIIDGTGVGEYRAVHIEAENFMSLGGGRARKGHDEAGSFGVYDIGTATAIEFPHVLGARPGDALTLRVANVGPAAATVVARRSSALGPVLARCEVPPTGGAFALVRCPFAVGAADVGDVDLVFTFDAEPATMMALVMDFFAIA